MDHSGQDVAPPSNEKREAHLLYCCGSNMASQLSFPLPAKEESISNLIKKASGGNRQDTRLEREEQGQASSYVKRMTPLVSTVLGYPTSHDKGDQSLQSPPQAQGSTRKSSWDEGGGENAKTASFTPRRQDLMGTAALPTPSLDSTSAGSRSRQIRKDGIGTGLAGNNFLVEQSSSSSTICSLASGHSHTLCCLTDGSLYAWGRNDVGQLGIDEDEANSAGGMNATSREAGDALPITSSAFAFATSANRSRERGGLKQGEQRRNEGRGASPKEGGSPTRRTSFALSRQQTPTRVQLPDLYHVNFGAMAFNVDSDDENDDDRGGILSRPRSNTNHHTMRKNHFASPNSRSSNRPPSRHARFRKRHGSSASATEASSVEHSLGPSFETVMGPNTVAPPLSSDAGPHGRISARVVACGAFHTLVITSSGALYTFGRNNHGCLGLGDAGVERHTPTMVTDFISPEVKRKIQRNKRRTTKISSSSKLLKDGTSQDVNKDEDGGGVAISTLSSSELPTIVSAAGGLEHSLVLTKDGSVYAFGRGSEGQLGDGKMGTLAEDRSHSSTGSSLVHVASGDSEDSASCKLDAGGMEHGRALDKEVGDEDNEMVGQESEDDASDLEVSSLEDLTTVGKCSFDKIDPQVEKIKKSATLTSDDDEKSQQDNHPNDNIPHRLLVPTVIEGVFKKRPVIMIACSHGGHGSYAVTAKDGYGWHWGIMDVEDMDIDADAEDGGISIREDHRISVPVPLPPPLGEEQETASISDSNISGTTSSTNNNKSSAGTSASVSAAFDSTLSASQHGALSLASQHMMDHNDLAFPAKMGQIQSFAAGARHLVCVTRDGEVFAMGGKGSHLGLGPACRLDWYDATAKMLLPGHVLVTGVACGERHTILSTACGKVFGCGDSSCFQLGLGSFPGDVISRRDVVASNQSFAVPVEIPIGEIDALNNNVEQGDSTMSRQTSSTAVKAFAHGIAGNHLFGRDRIVEHFNELRAEAERKRLAEFDRIAEESRDNRNHDDRRSNDGTRSQLNQEARKGLNPWQRMAFGTRAVGQKLGGVVSAVTGGKQQKNGKASDLTSKDKEIEAFVNYSSIDKNFVLQDVLFSETAGSSTTQLFLAAGYQCSFAHFLHLT
jgi:alpha-tubulin suppressor-like RCC1 family protein